MKNIPYGHQCIDNNDIKAVENVLKSDWLTQGLKVKEFERALSDYTGAKYAVVTSSGTAALHLACLAAGIKKGNKVITSPITFVASANCILYCGGQPVFVDIESNTANIDSKKINYYLDSQSQSQSQSKPKAIIPIHFSGHPCDMDGISKIAKRHNLLIIEDAAHALGAKYKGSRIGSCKYSDMAVFSFHPVKAITTGEGGAILTNRKDLYERLKLFRAHGITKKKSEFKANKSKSIGDWFYEMQELGFNYRLTDFQCALGISQLKKLDKFIEKRRKITNIYNQELSRIDKIILPKEKLYVKSAWHIYCIRLKNSNRRKEIFEKLQKLGIGTQVHYIPIHLQPYYRERFGYKDGDYPKAEEHYKGTITLPLYPRMTNNDVKYVVSALKKSL